MPAETINELFARTLSGDYESDSAWDAVRALRTLGNRDVLGQAAEWCSSQEPLKRARGADILAQLGKTAENPKNAFPEESFAVVIEMLKREIDPLPLASAIHALGHIDGPRAISILVQYRSHPNENVRFAVATALGNFPNDSLAIQALIQLTGDTDDDVRDWATFGLGVQGNQDSPQIREALAARLNDPCKDAREEAMIGLAKRKDQRVLAPLIASLGSEHVPDRAIEAASEMLDQEDEEDENERWKGMDYAAALKKKFQL